MNITVYKLFIVLALTFFSKKFYGQSLAPYTQKRFILHTDSLKVHPGTSFNLQKDSYVKNLTFFCRQEWKLEKALKIPLRFRVGSLDQCNKLEGKN